MRTPTWAMFFAFACAAIIAAGASLPVHASFAVTGGGERLSRYVGPPVIVEQASMQVEVDAMAKRAEAGDVDAQFHLALLGLSGRLGQNNARESVRLLGIAANGGHAEARFLLATLFLHGRGVRKDEERALTLYRAQAESGHAGAQNALGQMLLKGQGGPPNAAEAVKWFARAAEQSLAAAQSNLGYAYAHGHGVAPDKRRALEYFRMAAEQGIAGAQHNLAWMYQHGEGTTVGLPTALEWYRKAADKGYARSQFNLGVALLAYGKENEQAQTAENVIEAIKWLILASASNDSTIKSQARETLLTISAAAGSDAVTEASEAARMWTWQQSR